MSGILYIWISSYWSQEGGGSRVGWGLGGVLERNKRGNVPLLGLGHVGSLYLWESPQSDLSVIELCDNTNILLTVCNPETHLHENRTTKLLT